MNTNLFINGRSQTGEASPFDVVDPATGSPWAQVPAASAAQVDRAVEAAVEAQKGWQALAQPERTALMHEIASVLRANSDSVADVVTHETGRPRTRNLLYVEMMAQLFDQYAELARVFGGRIAPSNDPGQLSLVKRAPYGVIAALIPWNYPLLLLAFKIAPALATGNTVVIKPASETTVNTLLLGELFGPLLPPGVINVVAGSGRTVGEQLVRHPHTDMVAFTGSTEVGVSIGTACAEMVKPAHLELGGKDPAIVWPDVDVARAAQAVTWAAFLNAGQVCTSTERVYVHSSIHDEFVANVVRLTNALKVGDPFDADTQIGPMRNQSGRSKVLDQVSDAADRGATVVAGGSALDRPGFFMAPTVVVDVDHSMDVMREESFGPVMPIMPFEDDDEALALAADTPYGLGASVYTLKGSRIQRAFEELRVGTVWANDPVVDNLAAPFGGMRASGNVRELGLEGMEAFTVPRHVHWNLELEEKPWWYPYEEES